MFHVVITDYNFRDLSPEEDVLIQAGCSLAARRTVTEAELPELVGEADGVITQFAPITARVIGCMRKCRSIVRYGVGFDNVDVEAAARRGIPVSNVPDYCVDEVADHALALILSLVRQIPPISNRVRAGEWRFTVPLERMFTLKALTVGIVGFGRIGRAVAGRLAGFGGVVTAFDPMSTPARMEALGVRSVALDELLATSDVITIHCPSTPETRHLIRAETLARMKPGVILINVARGSIVQQDDLVMALNKGQIAAAGLDVTDPEPIPSDSPLLKMDNVVITNHIAAYSALSLGRLQRLAAETLLKTLRGDRRVNVVNGVE